MKSFNAILTIGSILAFAGRTLSAPVAPAGRRIETHVEYVTEVQTVGVTMTVWVPPGGVPTTITEAEADPTSTSSSTTTTTEEETTTSTTSSTSTEETTSTSSSTTEEEPTSTSTPPPPPTSTKEQKTTTQEIVTPTPEPEPTTPTPEPTPIPPPPTEGKNPFDGKATFYDVGMGSCGHENADGDIVVAMSYQLMTPHNIGGNPNNNDLCGLHIVCTSSHGTEPVTIKVVDTCPGCEMNHIDLSKGAFAALGGTVALGVIDVHCSWLE